MKTPPKSGPKHYKNYEDFLKSIERRYLTQDQALKWTKVVDKLQKKYLGDRPASLHEQLEHHNDMAAIMGIRSMLVFLSVDLTNDPVFTNDN